MATNQESEFNRLRKYLNPAIKGKNVNAVLESLAVGSAYLVNSVEAVNDNLFITTASGQYLDLIASQYGIVRDPRVGIADQIFRNITIQVKNRKQVRDLINNLLNIVFLDELCKATVTSTMVEPYDLDDGDTLIINFDGGNTVTVPFQASSFTDINNATAIEVADAIVSYLTSQNLNGLATIKNNGIGNYVELVSSTIGPRSSVTVLGGRAQNALIFPTPSDAGGNMSTQWTLSTQPGGKIRFTWTGGSDPNLGKLVTNDYVNIYNGGFASSSNVGTYTILDSSGGVAGVSYFEVYNPLGTTGIITQGTDTAMLFFSPTRNTITSKGYYAALYQTETNVLQIFMPATTSVVRRSRIGSAHLHDPPRGTFTFNAQPSFGDSFSITSLITFLAGSDFVIGGTILETVQNIAAAITALNTGLVGLVNSDNVVYIQNSSLDNILTISYSGAADIVGSGPEGSNVSLESNQQGPYCYDPTQPFTVGAVHSKLTEDVNSTTSRVVLVENSDGFPNSSGYVIFDYGGPTQELAAYLAVPSSTTILLSPINNLQFDHPIGQEIRFVANKAPPVISPTGDDYQFFCTDVVGGRVYAQELIESVAAAGIVVNFIVLYPNSIGLGKSDTPYDEIRYIYGPNPTSVQYPINDLLGS